MQQQTTHDTFKPCLDSPAVEYPVFAVMLWYRHHHETTGHDNRYRDWIPALHVHVHVSMMTHLVPIVLRLISTSPSSRCYSGHAKRLVRFNSVPRLLQRAACGIPRLGKRGSSSNTVSVKPVFLNAMRQGYADRTAIVDSLGQHTYEELIGFSTALAQRILAVTPRDAPIGRRGSEVILNGERVALLCPNNVSFVISQFAAWMSGCTVVPLCKVHPLSELDYVISDSQSSVIIATREFSDKANSLAQKNDLKVLILNEDAFVTRRSKTSSQLHEHGIPQCENNVSGAVQDIVTVSNHDLIDSKLIEKQVLTQKWSQIRWKNRKAMILYTSGTTGPPKGVVTTFAALQAQISMMVEAWCWSASDVILHVLPLHHFHGLVNVLVCPLWCGATCVMMPEFDVDKVWDRLLDDCEPRVNLFMGVPTIYAKLIERFESKFIGQKARAFIKAKLKDRIRLMVAGSAALPQPVLDQWESITGHRLLERYGMTEIGMALTNPVHGVRVPGAVGNPFSTVEARIVDGEGNVCVHGTSKGSKVTPGSEAAEGELQVRGPAIFKEYWNRPDATAEAFTNDGWFRTGDTATFQAGVYRILGRTSVDIIKSGGYKISALDVERHLLAHSAIRECAVVGLPDVTWGQRVAAIVALQGGPETGLTLQELRAWAKDHMAPYTIPTELRVVDAIPRNAMGKVNKKQLLADVFELE
ncbi:acyl-CoA synthetase family member 3, mitochondrial-like isoform X2 [Acanthaster planci]|uniref:Acyl-CoA synthetase family member 3, mitochondrial-like isoform X2 n=1 Tax=Acanthaster planci TaxID=133434 RepID=A0A8B7XJV0_ACAPL|nr:acyl-CoA synthetase family member 3, mitochondrial-like isoform X2 [Acanthaster planci]